MVLDEAHTIKSSKSQVSMAAASLIADRRWCLTGTPIQVLLLSLPLSLPVWQQFLGLNFFNIYGSILFSTRVLFCCDRNFGEP